MSEKKATPLVHFRVEPDGSELHLVIAKEIWTALRKIAVSKESPVEHQGFVHVGLSKVAVDFATIIAQPGTDTGCKP